MHFDKTECIFVAKLKINWNYHLIKSQSSHLGIDIDNTLTDLKTANACFKKVKTRLRFMYEKVHCLSAEGREIWQSYNIIMNIRVPHGMLEYLKCWKKLISSVTNTPVRFIKYMDPVTRITQTKLSKLYWFVNDGIRCETASS